MNKANLALETYKPEFEYNEEDNSYILKMPLLNWFENLYFGVYLCDTSEARNI